MKGLRAPTGQPKSVLAEINRLERSIGYSNFKSTFKTITCDNGVEFSLFNEIEQSCKKTGTHTQLYFCHPFASSERGSNENANKLIRKYIPKGADISQYSDDYISFIERTINSYPRSLFGGISSIQ